MKAIGVQDQVIIQPHACSEELFGGKDVGGIFLSYEFTSPAHHERQYPKGLQPGRWNMIILAKFIADSWFQSSEDFIIGVKGATTEIFGQKAGSCTVISGRCERRYIVSARVSSCYLIGCTFTGFWLYSNKVFWIATVTTIKYRGTRSTKGGVYNIQLFGSVARFLQENGILGIVFESIVNEQG